jgi:hypothetical protein
MLSAVCSCILRSLRQWVAQGRPIESIDCCGVAFFIVSAQRHSVRHQKVGYKMRSKSVVFRKLILTADLFSMLSTQKAALSSSHTTKVFKSSGALQCRPASGVPLDVMRKTLSKNNIRMLSSFCAGDGGYRIALCDSDAGLFNVYEIETRNLKKAMDLGFADISKMYRYEETPCS